MKKVLLSAVILSSIGLNAQQEPAVKTGHAVGIETTSPRATLDVNGDARLQKVELMTTTTPTSEVFPDCPCVLTIDKFGVIKRIPKSQFVLADGSTGSGGNSGGNSGGQPGGQPGGGGNNQSSGGANLGTGVRATINDQEEYVVSFIYDGQQIQGKIDNDANKVVVNIPYTNGNGAQYNTATSTTTTNVASSQDGQSSPITMTIKAGTLATGTGALEAEITTPALYNVKKLAPGAVETIAEFKYTVNDVTRKVVLKAVGGVPDKQFNVKTNNKYEHRFIYVPVTVKGTHNVNGKPYSKVWLNQNLGADYANLDGGHFSPKKVGGDNRRDTKAYGSLFQWGRVDDTGYELINWNAGGDKRLYPSVQWKRNDQLGRFTDACPKGYHTPSKSEWEDLSVALTGERDGWFEDDSDKNIVFRIFPPAGTMGGSPYWPLNWESYSGRWWSRDPLNDWSAYDFKILNLRQHIVSESFRDVGDSVRCIKD